ncbi:adenosine deaminase [Folsomia candida]|uniref:adenosine deaminase n=1 Tax=Folsomia candida TaxID=158441 RepID=UPI000B8FBDF3|nr:adenosine deaminase [Folsomia candida]XP_035703150.1 adenosine deaminase [Folsomia candida]
MFGVQRTNRGGHLVLDTVDRPLTRVELHVHIDGSIRHETVYEIAKEKKLRLPGRGTFEELVDYLVVKSPTDLCGFLSRFDIVLACLKGDLVSIQRLGYEFVEDCSKHGIIYAEARFCPHILIPDDIIAEQKSLGESTPSSKKWVWDVASALIKGLRQGRTEFGCHVNLIATCIRGMTPVWYTETIELLLDKNFHGGYIAGLDIAALPETACESHMIEKEALDLFDMAVKHGIHRTVHAGESGGAFQVMNALDLLHAERIGHGYRIVEDASVYNRVKQANIHLECCPWSSLLTGAVSLGTHPHPIVKFFQDGFNLSINTDDPTMTGTRLDDEFKLLSNWGLCEAHFVRASFNAARSCFLPEGEKKDLIQKLGKNYGAILL